VSKEILLIDDDLYCMQPTVDFLTLKGFAVQTARDVPRAREAIRNTKFDAIIADCFMPTGDKDLAPELAGLRLVEDIRSGSHAVGNANRRTPILVMTAGSNREILSRLRCMDVQAVIQKPFLSSELVEMLCSLLPTERDSTLNR